MKPKVLIACIGNIFLGDDAFGVEAARLFAASPLPEGVEVRDLGIRSFDLAYALLDDWSAVILVDAVSRGEAPGTLFFIEPDLSQLDKPADSETFDAHTMDPVAVLRLAKSMGEIRPTIYVVGCEPADLGGVEGHMGLTPPVEAALPGAVEMALQVAQDVLAKAPGDITFA